MTNLSSETLWSWGTICVKVPFFMSEIKVAPSFLREGQLKRQGEGECALWRGILDVSRKAGVPNHSIFLQTSCLVIQEPIGPALWTLKTSLWLWAQVLLWLTLGNLVWIEDERCSDFQLRKLVCSQDPKFNLCETDGQVWPCLLISNSNVNWSNQFPLWRKA